MKTTFDYTLRSLQRFGTKNIVIALIFTLLVWLLSSALMITHALNHELKSMAQNLPEIIIQNYRGGKQYPLHVNDIEPLWEIPGIDFIQGRVWGQYYFDLDRTYVSLMGIDPFEKQYKPTLSKIAETFPEPADDIPSMLVSPSLQIMLTKYSMQGIIHFLRNDGRFEKVRIGGIFKPDTALESNDLILLPQTSARHILGIQKETYTDAVIHVPNPEETLTIAAKITHVSPHLRIITKEEIIQGYQMLYDYKSGWFLALLLISFVTFAIILYDKASGLRSEEKQEIGILKALGWEIDHIIRHKLTEALILSMGAFILGFTLAVGYVFILEAPVLKYIFTGYSRLKQPFPLPFVLDIQLFALLFFTTVPLYLAASIIPSWKAAVQDAGEVMR